MQTSDIVQLAAILDGVKKRIGRRIEVRLGTLRFREVSYASSDFIVDVIVALRFRKGSRWFQIYVDGGSVFLERDSHGASLDERQFDVADPNLVDYVVAYVRRKVR